MARGGGEKAQEGFSRILGNNRGYRSVDTLGSGDPSQKAYDLKNKLIEQLHSYDYEDTLHELSRHNSMVEDRFLLRSLADELASSASKQIIEREEPHARQLLDDLAATPSLAEEIVLDDGEMHVWAEGVNYPGQLLIERSDQTAWCGKVLTPYAARVERGSWREGILPRCLKCEAGEEHFNECQESSVYPLLDADILDEQNQRAASSLRFALRRSLSEHGQIDQAGLDVLANDNYQESFYQAAARQAKRDEGAVFSRLGIHNFQGQSPLWYHELRQAAEAGERGMNRRQTLISRLQDFDS
jgi:hypothetical protein